MTFTPPPYPYERLDELRRCAQLFDGGAVDCSIGTPIDAPPAFVVDELARGVNARGYPPSVGTKEFRESVSRYLLRRFNVELDVDALGACVGTKEFVASLAGYLRLREPEKDTVLYPAVCYPTYEMSATLTGLRPIPVAMSAGRLDLSSVTPSDRARALLLWVNSPSNPTGYLDDLEDVAAWGRRYGVLVASDECYAEFTWSSRPRTILENGPDGVLAVHSASKRSNLAGLRAGFYAGDRGIVSYLKSVRQHAGLMVPGPVQSAVTLAYDDDAHVSTQRSLYHERLTTLREALQRAGVSAPMPEGTFYLWCSKEGLSDWELASWLASTTGLVVSPGELYGSLDTGHVRIAVVQPSDRLEIVATRLSQQ